MSCVEISPDMRYLLDALRCWPVGPEVLDRIKATAEWDQARAWGWVMESGELTGTGLRHAGQPPKGITRD
jgi:hypothetical protein